MLPLSPVSSAFLLVAIAVLVVPAASGLWKRESWGWNLPYGKEVYTPERSAVRNSLVNANSQQLMRYGKRGGDDDAEYTNPNKKSQRRYMTRLGKRSWDDKNTIF